MPAPTKTTIQAASGFDDKTLDQLVGMQVENIVTGSGFDRYFRSLIREGPSANGEVKKAASEMDEAVESVIASFAGDEVASKAMANEAGYLVFMTMEGHGVGINDGDLDDIGLDLSALRNRMTADTGMGYAYRNLRDAITDQALETVQEVVEEWVDEAKDEFATLVSNAEEYEKSEDNLSNYFSSGVGEHFVHDYSSVKRFAENEINDSYVGDLAEVVQRALDQGRDEDEILDAMDRIGSIEFKSGFHRVKNCITAVILGETEISIDLEDIKVKNQHGEGLTAWKLVELLHSNTFSDFDVSLGDLDSDKREVLTYINLDGAACFFVDPKDLASELDLEEGNSAEEGA